MKITYENKDYYLTSKDYQDIQPWLDPEFTAREITIEYLETMQARNPDAERERWYDNLSWKQKLCTWDFWQWWLFLLAVALAAYCILPELIMIIGVFVLFFGKILFGRDIEKF